MWCCAKAMLQGDSGKAQGRAHGALSPLCSRVLDSLVSLLGQPGTGGRRLLLKSAPMPGGCRDSHRAWGLGQAPQPRCAFPACTSAPFLWILLL